VRAYIQGKDNEGKWRLLCEITAKKSADYLTLIDQLLALCKTRKYDKAQAQAKMRELLASS
jgi:hypothetical protein